ncbi:hypothetical protein Bmyc01_33760 [Bacillus mycoides]|uniref:Uncharacterized protein n=1 Tax=Bacillus proteolyticus TaxID=2026192 RepID=A0ABV3IAL6_9BACI|nr:MULTISPECIES: hypothetical protein [Bacillus]PGV51989.1 hypothetical protein COD94_31135 [Bacillus cereus]GLV64706.1 hypothetical protein Bmyc01_33760 [Bacillus mycoides]MBJ8105934.1 hypothetical protein [Bacillus cereus group sp. N8]MED1511159.1 hypothetical protein [Bacillus proteolyticus]OJD58944.1 hypothetical protein BAU27_15410 [Bacillus sp. NH11B]
MREKERLKQWRADLQQIILEKSKEKRKKKKMKNKKYSIPGNTADFMNGKNTYRKENGVWKQRNK